MMLHIQIPARNAPKDGLFYRLSVGLAHPLGILSLFLGFVLMISESFYRWRLNHDGSIYLAGWFSILGLSVLLLAVWRRGSAFVEMSRRVQVDPDTCIPYLRCTDEYLEKGVTMLWSQRYYWSMLRSVRVRTKSVWLDFGIAQVSVTAEWLAGDDARRNLIEFAQARWAGGNSSARSRMR